MCSQQPEISRQQLASDPEYAFDCLQALVARLLARRELSPEEAREYLEDPRTGDFQKPLKRIWEPPRKEKISLADKGKTTEGKKAKNSKKSNMEQGTSTAGSGAGLANTEAGPSKKSGDIK